MSGDHLSEKEIQQYVLDKTCCETNDIEHIELCIQCSSEATLYRELFYGIAQQPGSAFDFDLASLVVAKLQPSKKYISSDRYIAYAFIALIACCISIPAYMYRGNLASMFNGVSILATGLIITVFIFIAGIQCRDMFRKYERQMNALN